MKDFATYLGIMAIVLSGLGALTIAGGIICETFMVLVLEPLSAWWRRWEERDK